VSSVDTSIGQGGTFAQGPASPVQPPGMGITTVPTFLSPPANLSAAFTSGSLVVLASFPPAGPIDGQQAILELPSTYDPVGGKKIRWAFAFNSGDAVWDFIGGPALYAEVQTSEGTASTVYAALTTAGPSIVLPRPGDYTVVHGAAMSASANGLVGYMSYDIGATGAVDADAASAGVGSATAVTIAAARAREKAGLTAVTLTAKYKGANQPGTATFASRWLKVTPVRIT
jgi:hypothetical protein